MKKLSLLLLIFFTLSIASEKPLIIGIPPWKKESELRDGHRPLLEYLEKRLQRKIYFEVTKDYTQLIDKIETKQMDVAFLPPNLYVQTKEAIPSTRYLAAILNK